jgi:2,4-dienoyl-CoA reductase-like NADH-dependent reductase (Old Yellow Enzyme family)
MSALFSPLTLRGLTLANRVVISPMCQYSADHGSASDWHIMHLGSMALSGAGLVIIEATGVEPRGRISPGCLGLYSDDNEKALARVLSIVRRHSETPIGIQLGHAGRKASINVPWRGGKPLTAAEGAWATVGPSALPFDAGWHVPAALDRAGMKQIIDAFVAAARRAERLGLALIEVHSAHGYLLSQFLSPIANRRTDDYGGSLENRLRFPLELLGALRQAWPDKPLGARLNGSDWVEGGIDIEQAVAYAAALKKIGVDYVCCSGGAQSPAQKIPVAPHYQVPFAAEIKKRTGIATMAVGMITDPKAADGIIAKGEADLIALARAVMDNPRWPWHAADLLGAELAVVKQYERARPKLWPGARLVRPNIPA